MSLSPLRCLLVSAVFGFSVSAWSSPVELELQADRTVVVADSPQDLVLRMKLHADSSEAVHRARLNLCLILDRSGSMAGNRIERLKEAAIAAVGRLRSDDVLSIVAYGDEARVLLPATKLRDPDAAISIIRSIQARGAGSLYAGIREGLAEAKKYQDTGAVSRVLLVSSGLANQGPIRPVDFEGLVKEANRAGIPLTTFYLGQDDGEKLLIQLARATDGNYAFIPDETALSSFLEREQGEAFKIAAKNLNLEITLGPGVHLKSSLNRWVQEEHGKVEWHLNQLPGGTDKRLLLELRVPSMKLHAVQDLASVGFNYESPQGSEQTAQHQRLELRSGSAADTARSVDAVVTGQAAEARANLSRESAIERIEKGDAMGASQLLQSSAESLQQAGLGDLAAPYASEAAALIIPGAPLTRLAKSLKAENYRDRTQQSY